MIWVSRSASSTSHSRSIEPRRNTKAELPHSAPAFPCRPAKNFETNPISGYRRRGKKFSIGDSLRLKTSLRLVKGNRITSAERTAINVTLSESIYNISVHSACSGAGISGSAKAVCGIIASTAAKKMIASLFFIFSPLSEFIADERRST